MVGLSLFAVIAIWMLVSIDGFLTLVVFGPTVVVVYIAAKARHRVKRYREATRQATGKVTESLGETFGAVQAIKVAGAEHTMVNHFRRLSNERRTVAVKD
jgi:ATP-binding cassette subfamily B protein/ATP-binding cassette subfamily C protein